MTALAVRRSGRAGVAAGLGAVAALLPLGIAAQPRWVLRDDLVSGLASRGADLPWLGRGAILAVAAAHVGAALVLLEQRTRSGLVAACAGLAAAAAAAGIALVPITCPRGASGCSGPDSGRTLPRPLEDVVHRDLVVLLEAGSLVLVGLLTWQLWRQRRHGWALLVALALVASPVLLGLQQRGQDIGWWQLSWLVALCVPLAVVAVSERPAPATSPATQPSAAPQRKRPA